MAVLVQGLLSLSRQEISSMNLKDLSRFCCSTQIDSSSIIILIKVNQERPLDEKSYFSNEYSIHKIKIDESFQSVFISYFKNKIMSGISENSNYNTLIHELVENSALSDLVPNQHNQLFPFAEDIPESLHFNLESTSRVVKKILTEDSNEVGIFRGFYFQLLKLCFQYDVHEETSKDYLQITKQLIFDPSFIENEELVQHIKHLAQFFLMMEDEETQDFQDVIAGYNQIDHAFIVLFGSITSSNSQISHSENKTETILTELCELFEVSLLPNHPYYKFEESDIYIFLDGKDKMYLIYEEGQEEEEEEQEEKEEEGSHISGSQNSSKHQISSISKEDSKMVDSHKFDAFSLSKEQSQKQRQSTPAYLTKEDRSRPGSNHSNQSAKSGYFSQSQPEKQKKMPEVASNQIYQDRQRQNFKKGSERVSNPYELSSLPTQKFQENDHYYSPPTRDLPKSSFQQMHESNYTNNASHYMQGPKNTSAHLSNSRNDTIINMFGDMLKSGKFQTSMTEEQSRGYKKLENTEKILESQQQFENQHSSEIYPSFAKKVEQMKEIKVMDRAKSVNSVNEHSNINSGSYMGSKELEISIPERNSFGSPLSQLQKKYERKNYSDLQIQKSELLMKEPSNDLNIDSKERPSIVNFDEDDSIFYKPKKSQLKVINEVASSKESITQRNSDKWDQTKGSIYRQFSDTRILKLLKEPHKTKVQLMRNRFKGQHFNS